LKPIGPKKLNPTANPSGLNQPRIKTAKGGGGC
jgi:hypothetical protein